MGFKGVICGSFLEYIWIVSSRRIVIERRKGQEGDDGDDGMINSKEARERKVLVRKNEGTRSGGDLRRS